MSRLFRGRRLLEAQLRPFAIAEGYVRDAAAENPPIDLAAYRQTQAARNKKP